MLDIRGIFYSVTEESTNIRDLILRNDYKNETVRKFCTNIVSLHNSLIYENETAI
jgi:hypothetical protein